jgi:myo-inositol-1(or 4)-monophosphatase
MKDAILTAAKSIAREAGQLALDRFGGERVLTQKGFRDFVTDADYAAQTLIVQRVREQFPEHGFLAEEDDPTLCDNAEFVWIIDPIDGTTNYSRNIPVFSVSIGIAQAGIPIVGVVFDPVRDELFWATSGGGAFVNDRPIAVSQIDTLADAIISHDWSRSAPMREKMLQIISRLAHQTRSIRAVGSAAIALCWVASGRVDAYLNVQLSAWDVAAGQLILTEAGGKMSGFNAEPFALNDPDSWALASNQLIHASL